MIPYLFVLLFSSWMAYFGRRFGSIGVGRISLSIVILALTVFAGLRAPSVGTDTENYISIFQQVSSTSDVWRTKEIGFNTILVFTSFISDHYSIFLLVISLVVVTFYVAGAVLMAQRYEIAIFLFVSVLVYTFSFNGARQAIAASICFFSLYWFLKRQLVPYFCLIISASLFHQSALILLPFYFLSIKELSIRHLIFLVAGVVVLTVSLSFFVGIAADLINDRYAYYAQEEEGGGEVLATFLLGQGLVLYALRSKVRPDIFENYNKLLAIYLVGLIPVISSVIASVHASGIMRLHFYFSHCAFLLWPMFFASWKKCASKSIFSAVFFVVVLMFYVLTTMSFGEVYPYKSSFPDLW